MLSVNEAYSQAINADMRRMFHRVTIAGVTLDQTAVPKMTFNESVGSNSGVALGTSNSASLQLTLKNPAVIDYTEMLVEPESGIELPDGTIEWLPLGKFWVTDSSTSNDYKTVNLTCADGMYLMSDDYVSALIYPALVRDVAHEIAEQAGVELVDLEEWPEIYIRKKPEKLTLRIAIGYVAGCCGRNAKFNRYGKLELAWYKDTGITIEREQQYLDGFTRLNDQPLDVNFEIKGEDEKYKVTVVSDNNGNVIATPGTNILEGDTVTLSVVPFYKYELASISANISSGESVVLWQNADGDEYTFVQPDSDVTVTVTFKEKGTVGEVIVNPAVGGEYSFLQHPSFASPPTNKPYWAIFYKQDTSVGPNAKYYLVWFDSWSLGDKIYLSDDRRGYYLNIDGYYYCRGANNGRAQHYWDNAVWQGNGASGSPLSWRTGVGRLFSDYGLLVSNISLYDGDTLFFENNESEIGTVQTSFLVNNVDVREKGTFSWYACPDTYSTPLPGKHWMLTNKARVYKTGTDGEYEDLFSGSSYDPYILFFDGCVIQDIGKYYDFHEGNYLKITFSKLVVASYLNYKTFYYSNERTFNEECYIIISDPDYSSDYESGGGWEYSTGLYATNLSSSYFNNNSPMICDCVSAASEPMMFAMRKSVGATVTMEYTNPLITSKMVDSITAVVQGVSYTPSKVKHRGNPALEAGDIVTVPDRDGNYHTVLIMQQTLTFGGGMNAVITCPGQTEKKTNFSSTGALTTQIKQIVQEETSYQKRETDVYNSLLVSTMNRSMSSLSRQVTEDGAEIKLLTEWRDTTSLSLAELSIGVSDNAASIKSITEWQSGAIKNLASIEQKVDEQGASIDLKVFSAINELEIGGRNLIRNTAKPVTMTATATNMYRWDKFTPTTSPLKKGQTYCFSADVEILSGTPTEVSIALWDSAVTTFDTVEDLQIVNGHITGTITPKTDKAEVLLIYAGKRAETAGNSVKFSNIKLEYGTKATDWTPAPEDYSTTEEVESKIALEIGKIDLSVYATKDSLGDYAKTQEVSSALLLYAKTSDLANYATTDDLNKAIAGIDLSVYATNNQLESVEAQLSLAVLTDGNGNLRSAVHIGANQLTIDAGNFKLTAEGILTATGAKLTGANINGILETKFRVDDVGDDCTVSFGVGDIPFKIRAPIETKNYDVFSIERLRTVALGNSKRVEFGINAWGVITMNAWALQLEPELGGFLLNTWYSDSSITVTSDANLKHDIEAIDGKYERLFDSLKPVRYKYNNGKSNRYHTGFVAQEVCEAIESAELSTADFAAYVDSGNKCGLRYEEFIALNTNEIQKLKARVKELEERITSV